jgi:hypothetical protein
VGKADDEMYELLIARGTLNKGLPQRPPIFSAVNDEDKSRYQDKSQRYCNSGHHRNPVIIPNPVITPNPVVNSSREKFNDILKQLGINETQFEELRGIVTRENWSYKIDDITIDAYTWENALYFLDVYKKMGGNKTLFSIVNEDLSAKLANDRYKSFVKVDPSQIKSPILFTSFVLTSLKLDPEVLLHIFSLAVNFIPYVGQAKMLVEAIIGKDLITGDELKGWQRILNVVPLAVKPCSIMLKGLGKGLSKTVTAGIQSRKVTPALALFLKISTVTPTPIVKLIDEISVFSAMNGKVLSTAASEVKQAATGVVKMSQVQLNAVKVIKEGVDKLAIINSVAKNVSKLSPILSANNSSNNKKPQVPIIASTPARIRRRRSDDNDEIEDDIVVQKPNLKIVTSRAPEVLEKELVSIGSTGPKYKPAPTLGVDPYQNYIAARDSAIRSIGGLGADQVPHYVESVGSGNAHLVGRVNGSMSSDGTRWWRLDYSPQKGTHINWARIEKGGKLYQGSTSIGADEKIFFKLLQSHFGMLP